MEFENKMNFEIESYLNGEMSESERRNFEAKLGNDPALMQETEDARYLLELVKNQLLREKINSLDKQEVQERREQKGRPNLWISGIALFLLVVCAIIIGITKNELPGNPAMKTDEPVMDPWTEPESKELPPPTPNNSPQVIPNNSSQGSKKQFALQPPAGTSGVRGSSKSSGREWMQFIESVWQTKFNENPTNYGVRFSKIIELLNAGKYPDAYVQLQFEKIELTANDTLNFLKGYCLLEMKEGSEALKHFDEIKAGNPWKDKIDWYRVLAYLLMGDLENVRKKSEDIIREKEHSFKSEALKLEMALK